MWLAKVTLPKIGQKLLLWLFPRFSNSKTLLSISVFIYAYMYLSSLKMAFRVDVTRTFAGVCRCCPSCCGNCVVDGCQWMSPRLVTKTREQNPFRIVVLICLRVTGIAVAGVHWTTNTVLKLHKYGFQALLVQFWNLTNTVFKPH